MASIDDVRRIAAGFPGAIEGGGSQFAYGVVNKGKFQAFIWTWLERPDPKKPRVPNPDVLAVLVPDLMTREMMLEEDSEKFFTEPHYKNYPAVLVRLANIEEDELEDLILEGWRCRASKALQSQLE